LTQLKNVKLYEQKPYSIPAKTGIHYNYYHQLVLIIEVDPGYFATRNSRYSEIPGWEKAA